MGLDQYAYIDAERVTNQDGDPVTTGSKEYYWRKHSRLHEFMQSKWEDRGYEHKFNCEDLELNLHDMFQLAEAINNKYKDFTSDGHYFWGHEYQSEAVTDNFEQDIDFVIDGIRSLLQGKTVIYSCWW